VEVGRILTGFAVLATLGVLAIGALTGSLWLERRTELTLPAPTGPFAVGRATYDWVDAATLDTLAPVPGTERELLVWIWYPSAADRAGAIVGEYLPGPMRREVARARGGVMGFLTRDLSRVHAHSIANSAVSSQQPSYPVVILRAGASAEVWSYSTLAEDLASHGYVVVGFDAPYRTGLVVFPDGRVMRRRPENNPELVFGRPDSARRINSLLAAWTGDIGFALDQLARLNRSDPAGRFTGRLDLARVGVFGHSLGGAATAQFCHDDSRCSAGIDVDGAPLGSVIRESISRPFMFLLSDHGQPSDPADRQIEADIQSIYDRLPADGRLGITIRGANHFLFSDDAALLKSHIVLGALRRLGILGIDGRRQLAIAAYCVRSFFDANLKGLPGPRLDLASPLYPEIQVFDFRPASSHSP